MKPSTPVKVSFLSAFLFLLFSAAFSPLPMDKHHYRIETESQLIITGSSNVNEFSCDCSCERDFTQSSFEMAQHPEGNRMDFSNARLQLTTTNLDCGHKIMNKDLFETLRYKKYPHIYITLLNTEIPAQKRFVSLTLNQSINIDAFTRINIAGQDKRVHIPVKGQKMADNRYHFTGEVSLNMTDFGLDPPTAMFGLIKVNDKITIHLNLMVRLLDE